MRRLSHLLKKVFNASYIFIFSFCSLFLAMKYAPKYYLESVPKNCSSAMSRYGYFYS